MKKTLALVLALAMVFSTITVAFAEGTIGADAQICSDLGMLKGSTGTVDAAYVATTPTRIQAAVMFLRLKGLEADATAFAGEANFADAANAAWAKPIMAYLKANPQLGWAGDGTNFNPTNAITAKEYYKVMLEALGYKQNTAEVVGDFTWDNVVEFAAGKGLTKVAAVTSYTVNDLAIATVEALKLNVKDTTKTLVASLVEAGKVDAAKAEAAGIYTNAVTTTAEMKAVKAIANNKVEVEFTAEVAKAYAENVANYKVVVKGSTTALEVKSAFADSATKAVLETAAQGGGAAYTMTVGAVSKNFAGLAADKNAPKISEVKSTDTNTVEVKFDKVMDKETATNIANYTLNNNATVKAAALSSDRKKVTLTTEGVANNKVYSLKVENVKSSDLVLIKAISKSFTGTTDTKAPKIDKIDSASNNIRIIVLFDDVHGVDKASAENVANYKITSADGDLEVKSIIAKDVDEDDYYERVEITTAAQENGEKYTVKISNLVDGSVSANKITKDLTKEYRGKKADATAPKVKSVQSLTDTKFKVVFDESSRIDAASATNIANYSFNNDLEVKTAAIYDDEDLDLVAAKTVILTTNGAEEDDWYKLTVKDVVDEFGNTLKATTKNVKAEGEDVTPPYVTKVTSVSPTKVQLVYNEELDKTSAQDPTNYVFDNDLGAAQKATLEDDRVTVTLVSPTQVLGTTYKVTINAVKDINGNVVSAASIKVVTTPDAADTERPEVSSIEAVYGNVLRVTFDEPVAATAATLAVTSTAGGNQNLTMVGNLLDDGTTIEFKTNAWTMVDGREYTITAINNVTDEHNNKYVTPTGDDRDEFDGTDLPNPGPEVESWEQVDAKTFRVYFNEPVQPITDVDDDNELDANYTSLNITGSDDIQEAFTVTVDPDGDENDEGYSIADLVIANGVIEADKIVAINFSSIIEDYSDRPAVDEDDKVNDSEVITTDTNTELESYIEDEDDPEVISVIAVSNLKVEVTYNEDIDYAGTYKITYEDEDDDVVTVDQAAAGVSVTDNVVTIKLADAINSDTVYTLKQVRPAKDASGNEAVEEEDGFTFEGSDVIVQDYIRGVDIVDAHNVVVSTSKKINAANTIEIYWIAPDETEVLVASATGPATADYEAPVALDFPILDGASYRVAVSTIAEDITFDGVVEDGGIEIDDTTRFVTFSDWDTSEYVVKVIYDGVEYFVHPAGDGSNFVATTVYSVADETVVLDLENDAQVLDGSYYAVEVFRTTTDITSANMASEAAYNTAANAKIDDAPIYAIIVEKE